jgi:hypothetical protein
MSSKESHPVAVSPSNDVEAWEYPFYVKPVRDFEPPAVLLTIHVENLSREEARDLGPLVRIEGPEDLLRLGFSAGPDGVFMVGEAEPDPDR